MVSISHRTFKIDGVQDVGDPYFDLTHNGERHRIFTIYFNPDGFDAARIVQTWDSSHHLYIPNKLACALLAACIRDGSVEVEVLP